MRARLNSLGLVNFFGLVAFLPLAVLLAVFALNWVRRSDYSVFQRMHLPLGLLFVLFCALHDLPILLFAAPGLADWFFGWRFEGTAARTMPARVRVLKGTSGPWVEVTLDCAGDMAVEAAVAASKGDSSSSKNGSNAIREQWVSISFPEHLGKESHPFSIASLSSTELSVLVSAGAGDWTSRLATLSSKVEQATVSGPFPGGEGIDTSFGRLIENEEEKEDEEAGKDRQPESNTRLLLIVGGTGICGWLPALQAMKEDRAPSHAKIRLAWLVQTEADYTALAQRLPCSPIMDVTIFITRPSTTTTKQNLGGEEMDLIQSKNNGKEIPLCGRKSYGEREGKGSFTVVTSHQLGTTWASFPFVSLTAALVGLVVQHYLWRGWLISLLSWSRHGMITYTLVYRTLPIALILGCMAATIALGSRFMQQPSHPSVTRLGDSSYQRVGSFCEDQTQTGDEECPTNACEQMPVKEPDHDSPSNGISNQMESKVALEKEGKICSSSSGLHEVRLGRPDIAALVRETAAGLPLSRQGQGAPARLVVAVCGPPNMVIATRKVVKATQQSSACKHICLQFSGSDSRW
jgi:NAD(P)H-flavin reductase